MPATAVGEGDATGGEGGEDEARVGAAVAVAAGVTVPDGDAEADGPGENTSSVVVAAGVALSAKMADGVAPLGEGLEPA